MILCRVISQLHVIASESLVQTPSRPTVTHTTKTTMSTKHIGATLPATVPTPHRTPLRRLSQGSLHRLSRSHPDTDAPHGLGFLEPALSELLDEVEALQSNVEGLRALGDALGTFNESFASWLYVMNMNALTTDWAQAPTRTSFELAARRAGESFSFRSGGGVAGR